jgi:glutathione synthase/RimK-type ligase-like ATP-grasp enzyme
LDQLDQAEHYWALRHAIEALPPSRFPFGHPTTMRHAENKLLQLTIASQVGLRVPATMWSSSSPALRAFAHERDRVAIKPVHSSVVTVLGDSHSMWCSAIDAPTLISKLLQHETTALYCQELVVRSRDLRIVALPGLMVAFEIDLSGLPPGEVDWRPTTLEREHRVIALPQALVEKLEAYLARMELKSGFFDLGALDDGEYVFFECNPNAQWLWLEIKTGYPLSRLFAEALSRHSR